MVQIINPLAYLLAVTNVAAHGVAYGGNYGPLNGKVSASCQQAV